MVSQIRWQLVAIFEMALADQLVAIVNWLAVDGYNHVAILDASLICRSAFFDVLHEGALGCSRGLQQ